MQSSRAFKRSTLRGALLAAALLFSSAALAGPPLLCHPFDTAGAASLPWGGGWNREDRDGPETKYGACPPTPCACSPPTPR